MMLYKKHESKSPPIAITDYFDIVVGVLQGYTLAPYQLLLVDAMCFDHLQI